MDGCINGYRWMNRQMDGQIYEWMDGLMNGQMNGWLDGWIDGRTDGQTDRRQEGG